MIVRFRICFAALICLAFAGRLAGQNISSFSPAFGANSDPNFIIINGNGFSPGTLVVRFNGVASTDAAATTSSQIQARVPASAPLGPGSISVQVGGGGEVFSGQNFTVIGPGPFLNDFSPGTGSAGSIVTLHGAHFTGVTNVMFNGRNASTTNIQSDLQMTATAPVGATTGPITVRSAKGVFTTTTNFFVPPMIRGFSPSVGRAGTNFVITGTNFTGTTAVRFGSVFATSFTVLSNNAITVTVPTGAATGVLRVDAPAGAAITTTNFVVPPTILGFTPAFGPPATSVTITGANFQGVTAVTFNGAAATFSFINSNQVMATVPVAAASGPISITTSNGTHTSASLFYLPGTITSFTPTNGSPGTMVRINGNNFTNASAVTFNGTPAASFVVTNNTTIGAVVPAGVATGPIAITTPAGTTTSSALFYVAPSIISFNPTHGLPGTNVIITGNNFLGTTAVRFNGQAAASFTVNNNTTISAVVPNGAQTGPISVVTPGGTNTSAANFLLDYNSDLGVTITDAPDPVFIGSNLVYTIVIVNNGPFAAPNVRVTNTLPVAVTLKSATTSQGTLVTGGNPITGNLGTLGAGNSATITITIAPQAAGTITNTVTVASDFTDNATLNNTASVTTVVSPLPVLSIQRLTGNRVRVSWSVMLTNFGLEFKTSLNSSDSWSNNPTAPVISGSENVVTETSSEAAKFYRLRK